MRKPREIWCYDIPDYDHCSSCHSDWEYGYSECTTSDYEESHGVTIIHCCGIDSDPNIEPVKKFLADWLEQKERERG